MASAGVSFIWRRPKPCRSGKPGCAPTAAPLAVTISGLSANTAEIRAAVTAELAAQIRRDAAPGGTTRRSRLIEAVSRATGEEYHAMTVPSGDVVASAGTIHVLGTVTFA